MSKYTVVDEVELEAHAWFTVMVLTGFMSIKIKSHVIDLPSL